MVLESVTLWLIEPSWKTISECLDIFYVLQAIFNRVIAFKKSGLWQKGCQNIILPIISLLYTCFMNDWTAQQTRKEQSFLSGCRISLKKMRCYRTASTKLIFLTMYLVLSAFETEKGNDYKLFKLWVVTLSPLW